MLGGVPLSSIARLTLIARHTGPKTKCAKTPIGHSGCVAVGWHPLFATETRRHCPPVTGVEATVTIEGG